MFRWHSARPSQQDCRDLIKGGLKINLIISEFIKPSEYDFGLVCWGNAETEAEVIFGRWEPIEAAHS